MSTKINGIDLRPTGLGSAAPVTRPRDAAVAEGGDAPVPSADGRITDAARQMATLERLVAAAPVVNEARVSAVSDAIAQGRYRVDAERIADRLLRADADLKAAGGDDAE
jgi:negative regulator of flagellin synthesis FlgM